MRMDKKVKIIVRYGPHKTDEFSIDAVKAEIRWDKNSFMIRGLFEDNILKIEGTDNGDTR